MPPKPWEKYGGTTPPANAKPWEKYGATATAPAADEEDPYVPEAQDNHPGEIRANNGGVADWFNDLKTDIEYGGGRTLPGRALSALGAKGINRGVSEGAASIMGGSVVGPARMGHGVTKLVDPDSSMHERARGLSETIGGGLQTVSLPAAIAAPEILPEIVPSFATYGTINQAANQGLQAAGVDPDYAQATADLVTLLGPKIKQGVGSTGRFTQRNSSTIGKVAAVVPAVAKAIATKNPNWLLGGFKGVSDVLGAGANLAGKGMETAGNAKIFPHEVMEPPVAPTYSPQVIPPKNVPKLGGRLVNPPEIGPATSVQEPASSLPPTEALPGRAEPKQLGPATSVQVPESPLGRPPIRLKSSSLPQDPMSPEAGQERLGNFLKKSGLFSMKPEASAGKLVDSSVIEPGSTSQESQPLTETPQSDKIKTMVSESKPVPQRGGTAEGAARDTATIAQAKRELGENAPIRQILARAQEIKQQIAPDVLGSLGIKGPEEQGSLEAQSGLKTTPDQQLQATLNSKNQAAIFKAFVEAMNKKGEEGPLPAPPAGSEPHALITVPENTPSGMSRRDFLKTGVKATGGALLGDKVTPLVDSALGSSSSSGISNNLSKIMDAFGWSPHDFEEGEGPKEIVEHIVGSLLDNQEAYTEDPQDAIEMLHQLVDMAPTINSLFRQTGSSMSMDQVLNDWGSVIKDAFTNQRELPEVLKKLQETKGKFAEKPAEEAPTQPTETPAEKPNQLVETPKEWRTPEDKLDDQAIQQSMREDLDRHGEEANTVGKMLFFAKNKPDFAKSTGEQYGQNLNLPTRELIEFPKPKKLVDDSMLGPGAAAKNGPEFDDLLTESGDAIPKIREIRANPSLDDSIALQKAMDAGQKEPVKFGVPAKSDLGKKLIDDSGLKVTRDERPNLPEDKGGREELPSYGLKIEEHGDSRKLLFSPEAQKLLQKIGMIKQGQRTSTLNRNALFDLVDDLENEHIFGKHGEEEQDILEDMVDQLNAHLDQDHTTLEDWVEQVRLVKEHDPELSREDFLSDVEGGDTAKNLAARAWDFFGKSPENPPEIPLSKEEKGLANQKVTPRKLADEWKPKTDLLYHGTGSNHNGFMSSGEGGEWVTDNPDLAKTFGFEVISRPSSDYKIFDATTPRGYKRMVELSGDDSIDSVADYEKKNWDSIKDGLKKEGYHGINVGQTHMDGANDIWLFEKPK